MINVTRSSMPTYEEYCEEIKSLWDTHWLTNMGEKHAEFRKKLEHFLGVENIGLFVNGHMAIEMALQAYGLRGEVITTPYTFASTTHAIVRNGLTPVFCDIKDSDCTIDPEQIRKKITPNTCAIVPVHVYGNVCDIESINEIASEYDLKVVYDAAHAFGEKYKDTTIGSFGDASCFSFHATKAFNSIEGGAVSYHDKEYGQRLYELKNFGIHGPEEVLGVGANAKMNEFCAAMGICNLRHFEENLEKRKRISHLYREYLGDIEGLILNAEQNGVKYNYSYFPVFVDSSKFGVDRDNLQKIMYEKGIYSRKYFYPLTSEFECYSGMYESKRTPVALKKSREVLTLPLYADLEQGDVKRICDIIISLKKRKYV